MSGWGGAMRRKKKILIGVGVVVVARRRWPFANFEFKRTEGVTVNTEAIQKRNLEAIVSASGKIQPKRFVNISADTMGRVTELAVKEGDRVKQGSSCCRSTRATCATRVTAQRGVARRPRGRRREQLTLVARELQSLAQAGGGQPQAAAGALEGRPDDEAKRSSAPRTS